MRLGGRGKLWVSIASIISLVLCHPNELSKGFRAPQNATLTRRISHNPMITSMPKPLSAQKALYDADACRSSWISYVSSYIDKFPDSFVRSSLNTLPQVRKSLTTSSSCTTIFVPKTSTRTITSLVASECDKFERATSIGEVVESYTQTWIPVDEQSDYNWCHWITHEKAEMLPEPEAIDPRISVWGDPPNCSILSSDCPAQWKKFKDEFRAVNSTQVYWKYKNELHNVSGAHSYCNDDNYCFEHEDISLLQYLGTPSYAPKRDGFFANCPEAQLDLRHSCFVAELSGTAALFPAQEGTGREEEARSVDEKMQCKVGAERFMLIYFPPQHNASRNICGEGRQSRHVPPDTKADEPPFSAVVTDLTFSAHDLRYIWDDLYRSGPAPTRMTSSVMRGVWTFMSPSVYLAYASMSASPFCGAPKTYPNGVFTFDISDLSSIVGQEGQQTALPFDLRDLQAPVPASAYFAGSSERLFNGKMETKIVEGNYWPIIAMPTVVTSLDPGLLSTCKPIFSRQNHVPYMVNDVLWQNMEYAGVWDPPLELPTASLLIVPMVAATQTSEQVYAEVRQTATPGKGSRLRDGPFPLPTHLRPIPSPLPNGRSHSVDGIVKSAANGYAESAAYGHAEPVSYSRVKPANGNLEAANSDAERSRLPAFRTAIITTGGTLVTGVMVAGNIDPVDTGQPTVGEKTLIVGPNSVLYDGTKSMGRFPYVSSAIGRKGSSESERLVGTGEASEDFFTPSAVETLALAASSVSLRDGDRNSETEKDSDNRHRDSRTPIPSTSEPLTSARSKKAKSAATKGARVYRKFGELASLLSFWVLYWIRE